MDREAFIKERIKLLEDKWNWYALSKNHNILFNNSEYHRYFAYKKI